jgi:hypothetical protein
VACLCVCAHDSIQAADYLNAQQLLNTAAARIGDSLNALGAEEMADALGIGTEYQSADTTQLNRTDAWASVAVANKMSDRD